LTSPFAELDELAAGPLPAASPRGGQIAARDLGNPSFGRPAGETDIDGLAVANGRAYYITDGPNTTQANFYVFDVATGMQVGTIPSPFTGTGTFCAGTWVGAPSQTGTVFCPGDGSGTACPCANHSLVGAGEGCLTSFALGGKLRASGNASIANDTVVLSGSQMPDAPSLVFQGTNQLAGGLGAVFGDGLRCAGGTSVRLKQTVNVGGATVFPDVGDPAVSVAGNVTAPGARTYQVWFRNSAVFCTPDGWNLTNGVEITWAP
jgi:hypothetical protein